MDAATILAAPLTRPDKVFNNEQLEAQYRKLRSQFHPDHGGDGAVFNKIHELYDAACNMVADGEWPGVFEFEVLDPSTSSTRRYTVSHVSKHATPTGMCYVGRSVVAYRFSREFADVGADAELRINSFKFPTEDFRKEASRHLPTKVAFSRLTTAGEYVMVFNKDPDMFLLSDVLRHYGGKLPPKQAAWIISSLHNILCLTSYGPELAHCDVHPENVFINMKDHTALLLGGWGFAHRHGAPARVLPGRALALLPIPAKGAPTATPALMGALVRATGRMLLGNVAGSALLMNKDIPAPMLTFLRSPASTHASDDYAAWTGALEKSYGKRRFDKTELSENELYPVS